MNLLTIFVIALGLSMDAFAVSVASGARYKQLGIRHTLRISMFFGVFQAVMPLAGWLFGLGIHEIIRAYDHWVAFGLLTSIGCKMIYEAFIIKKAEKQPNPMNLFVLLTLSVATSIDALAVGITLSLLTNRIAEAIIIIGLVTFGLSYVGIYIGKMFGHILENRIEIVGGVILIGIGMKILIEHLISSG